MSDRPDSEAGGREESLAAVEASPPPIPEAPPPAPPPAPAGRAARGITIALAAALLLLAAVAVSAPFWAPALPWAPPAVDPRIDAIEKTLQQSRQAQQAQNDAVQQLERRIAALEARPAPPPAQDVGDLRRQVAALSGTASDLAVRVAALDKGLRAQQQAAGELATQVAAADKAAQAQTAATAKLGQRLDRLEAAITHAAASDNTDTAIVLVLLQIRSALAVGRPFAAEYETLAALAHDRPEIAAAAAPLAEPAKSGVAIPAVLLGRLHQLMPAVGKAAAQVPANGDEASAGWGAAILDRLRGLVRVERVAPSSGAPAEGSASAAVAATEQALAGGDLADAVAALDKLTGPQAAAAAAWLRMAKQRLAVETAMHRIETALMARLGAKAGPFKDTAP
ncbi:MAG: COG4223 family protein [Thiohalocapsa sp.]